MLDAIKQAVLDGEMEQAVELTKKAFSQGL